MSALGAWVLKFFVDYIWNKISSLWATFWNNREASKADQTRIEEVTKEIRQAGKDTTKTVQEREKEQEDAFDHYHNRLD
jgi:hypothetical protein